MTKPAHSEGGILAGQAVRPTSTLLQLQNWHFLGTQCKATSECTPPPSPAHLWLPFLTHPHPLPPLQPIRMCSNKADEWNSLVCPPPSLALPNWNSLLPFHHHFPAVGFPLAVFLCSSASKDGQGQHLQVRLHNWKAAATVFLLHLWTTFSTRLLSGGKGNTGRLGKTPRHSQWV